MNVREIKKQLKEKHRAKEPDKGVDLGSMPLQDVRVLPSPSDQRIAADKEIILNSIISRCGYVRNVHRTEGLDFRRLYNELRDFFKTELGVQEDRDGEGESEAPQPEPERSVRRPAEEPAQPVGEVRDEGADASRPQFRIPPEARRRRKG